MRFIPWSQVYVEPLGGVDSLFFRMKPRPVEVFNDVDGWLIDLVRLLQDPESEVVFRQHLISGGYDTHDLDINRSLEIFRFQTGGVSLPSFDDDWRRVYALDRTTVASIEMFSRWFDIISHVQVDSRPILDVIAYWDGDDTTQYVNIPCGRTCDEYLLRAIMSCDGKIVMSTCCDGNDYEDLLSAGWVKVSLNEQVNIYRNPRAVEDG